MLVLGLAWWIGPSLQGRERSAAAPDIPLDAAALEHAARVLAAQRALAERSLAPLTRESRRTVADFVALQAQAAELELLDISWSELPADGALVPVELAIQVAGSYYDLPILLDGLYRQPRPVRVVRIEVASARAMSARTTTKIRARFARPRSLSDRALRAEAESRFQDAVPEASRALVEAARLELLAAFAARMPELRQASASNREAVMRAVPGMLRRLPSSALGWVALDLGDGAPRILLEPREQARRP